MDRTTVPLYDPELGENLPEFDNPPVVEVVCGIQFEPLKTLKTPHLGVLWGKFKDGYPDCLDQPPLAPVIEPTNGDVDVEIELSNVPPLPRVWFVGANETNIIQVQRDRFLHNWKKVEPEDPYPRYTTVVGLFRQRFEAYEAFVQEADLGSIVARQYEMTYINHILQGEGWANLRDVGRVFPDCAWQNTEHRFLSLTEGVTWHTVYPLPHKLGRLHAVMRHALRRSDNHPLLSLELTVRGIGPDKSRDTMWNWFDLAHIWIVRSFADLTSPDIQQDIWRRTQ